MGKKRAMMIGLDGADPVVVKRLIAEGRLPNMKKVLEQGVATANMDMLGVFPTVTPPNWTTLATGNYPRTHGVTCFYNQTLGRDLDISESNWDSRRVESEFIWEAFEKEGKRCLMLNYCQAWPNRYPGGKNIFVDGSSVAPFLSKAADFQKVIHLEAGDFPVKEVPHYLSSSTNDCIVYSDQQEEFSRPQKQFYSLYGRPDVDINSPLMERKATVMMGGDSDEAQATGDAVDRIYSPIKELKGWTVEVNDQDKEALLILNKGLARRYAVFSASNGKDYDTVTIYANKKSAPLGSAKVGEWSELIYDTYNINESEQKVVYKIRVLDIAADGSKANFYLSHTMKCEDYSNFSPKEVGPLMLDDIGMLVPMANFDRFTVLGDQVTLESLTNIHDWHNKATDWLFNAYKDWQLFYIHLHTIDMVNHWYINQSIPDSHPDWARHHELIDQVYILNDEYIGTVLKQLDDDTTIFICADHAAIPRSPGYENPGIGELTGVNGQVMSDLGYTVVNKIDGVNVIDWSKTRAINHRTSHIYVNLKGRDPQGIVEPEDYDKLVQQIISDLYAYRDPIHRDRVVSFAMTREEMECVGMGGPHCGDIFFQLTKDFGIEHANTPNHVTNHGYSVGCLCLMIGSGLKSGFTMARPIRNVDIVPTICHLLGNRMPENVEGGIIYQALAE